MLIILFVFQLEISGKEFNDEQFLNKELISIIFFVFHLEITGNSIKEVQPKNKKLIIR